MKNKILIITVEKCIFCGSSYNTAVVFQILYKQNLRYFKEKLSLELGLFIELTQKALLLFERFHLSNIQTWSKLFFCQNFHCLTLQSCVYVKWSLFLPRQNCTKGCGLIVGYISMKLCVCTYSPEIKCLCLSKQQCQHYEPASGQHNKVKIKLKLSRLWRGTVLKWHYFLF